MRAFPPALDAPAIVAEGSEESLPKRERPMNGSKRSRTRAVRSSSISRVCPMKWLPDPDVSAGRTGDTGVMLLIDAANVVGSRPDGWWRDRPGAACAFVEHVLAAAGAGRLSVPVVVVLEGAARGGVEAGRTDDVTVLHAPGSGDYTLLAVAADADTQVTLVSADRALCQQAQSLGADIEKPGWLIDLLDG